MPGMAESMSPPTPPKKDTPPGGKTDLASPLRRTIPSEHPRETYDTQVPKQVSTQTDEPRRPRWEKSWTRRWLGHALEYGVIGGTGMVDSRLFMRTSDKPHGADD